MVRLREIDWERWLPLNIDPDTADFKDVGRVLKVLDDYSLRKLAFYEGEPLLPEIITIQREVRSWLRRTALHRCVYRGIKFIRGIKAIMRWEERLYPMTVFYRHEALFEADIKRKAHKRMRLRERETKAIETGYLSDSSSTKEVKAQEKAVFIR